MAGLKGRYLELGAKRHRAKVAVTRLLHYSKDGNTPLLPLAKLM
jgi:hypothetical protein